MDAASVAAASLSPVAAAGDAAAPGEGRRRGLTLYSVGVRVVDGDREHPPLVFDCTMRARSAGEAIRRAGEAALDHARARLVSRAPIDCGNGIRVCAPAPRRDRFRLTLVSVQSIDEVLVLDDIDDLPAEQPALFAPALSETGEKVLGWLERMEAVDG